MRYRGIWNSGGYPLAVIWKSLSWREYRALAALPARLRYAAAYRACLVDGPALEAAPAGIVTWIGRQQTDLSPFRGEYKPLAKALAASRKQLEASALEAAKTVIAWAFRYTFEEIDAWPAELFMERWARAEYVLGAKLEPQDPEAPPPEPKKAAPPRPRGLGQKEPASQETRVSQFRR